MADNGHAAQAGRCNNPACLRARSRVAGLAANAAMERKKRLDSEIRNGVDAARRGHVGGHGVMEADNGNEQYLLQNRLAGLKAIVEQSHGDEWREKAKRANQLWAQFQNAEEIPDPGTEEYPKWEALNHIIQKATEDHAPLNCTLCLEELTANDELFLGKNCYCLYHKSCVLDYARHKSRDLGDNTIFEWVGEERVWNQDKLGRFPAAAPLPCAKCRDCNFCSSDHWKAVEQAIPPVLEGLVEPDEVQTMEPEEAVSKARTDKYVWLLEVPENQDLVMLVPGKVPFDPAAKTQPHGFVGPDPAFPIFNFNQRLRECKPPFKYDFDGSVTGAKCYYRPMQQAAGNLPEHDEIPVGAKLTFTKPKQEGAIPSYKLDLPVILHPRFMARIIAGDLSTDDEGNVPLPKRKKKA